MSSYRILSINPGSTSTKIAVFDDDRQIFAKNICHATADLRAFNRIIDQYEFRKNIILQELSLANIDIKTIQAVVGRGGLLKPMESGVYEVNDRMSEDLFNCVQGEHASNLGGLIADDIASLIPGTKAYIADPVVVDELQDVARITGIPQISRVSIFHALNQKIIARTYAKEINRKYEEINLIVAHLGGGISVGAHHHGRVIDVNNALDGEGPFSPERSGSLPTGSLVKLCFSREFSQADIRKLIAGKGGFVAHLNTNAAHEVVKRAENGDAKAKLILDAMCYQIGKSIGAMACVLKGKVDGIILTGGISYNKYVCDYIEEMTKFIAPIKVYPGEDELAALAINGLMVLKGKVTPKVYK